jgi:hypothetical protein
MGTVTSITIIISLSSKFPLYLTSGLHGVGGNDETGRIESLVPTGDDIHGKAPENTDQHSSGDQNICLATRFSKKCMIPGINCTFLKLNSKTKK